MKSLIAVLAIISFNYSAHGQASPCPAAYFKLPLQLPSAERYYLSFTVEYKGTQTLACAQPSELYDYFKLYGLAKTKEEFILKMNSYLYKDIPLISPVPFDSLSFDFATGPNKSDVVAKRGESYFVKFFFNKNGCLRADRKISNAEIVKHLQRWCIWSFQDDETGIYIPASFLTVQHLGV